MLLSKTLDESHKLINPYATHEKDGLYTTTLPRYMEAESLYKIGYGKYFTIPFMDENYKTTNARYKVFEWDIDNNKYKGKLDARSIRYMKRVEIQENDI